MSVVLFDLDGTLIDPFVGLGAAYRAAAAAVGLGPLDDDEIRRSIGPPIQEVFTRWGLAGPGHDEAIAAFRAYYRSTGIREYSVYPGVAGLLGAVGGRRPRLLAAVATSKPVVFAEAIVAEQGWDAHLALVAGAELDGTRRAKAEVISYALERLGCSDTDTAAACVMVGDRAEDMVGAKAAGVRAIGVSWGYGSAAELEAAGADDVVARVDDLLPLLL